MELTLFFDLSRYIISETLFVKETVGIKQLGIHLITVSSEPVFVLKKAQPLKNPFV